MIWRNTGQSQPPEHVVRHAITHLLSSIYQLLAPVTPRCPAEWMHRVPKSQVAKHQRGGNLLRNRNRDAIDTKMSVAEDEDEDENENENGRGVRQERKGARREVWLASGGMATLIYLVTASSAYLYLAGAPRPNRLHKIQIYFVQRQFQDDIWYVCSKTLAGATGST